MKERTIKDIRCIKINFLTDDNQEGALLFENIVGQDDGYQSATIDLCGEVDTDTNKRISFTSASVCDVTIHFQCRNYCVIFKEIE